jgi:hypothetical protein
MRRAVPPTVALACSLILAAACVADSSLATSTPGITPAPPSVVIPANVTPVLPPRPVAPAAGTYFGSINGVDVPGMAVTFSAICVGADRKVMKELSTADKAPRSIPLLSTTTFSVFTSPPNNPAAGRMSTVDLPTLATMVPTFGGAKWFMMVNPQGVASIEQDSGVRPTAQPDDPCPHG